MTPVMFRLDAPVNVLMQPLLLLPVPVQVRRAWKKARPAVEPEVGAMTLRLAPLDEMLATPGLPPPLLSKMIVTPPEVSPGHNVLMFVVGGALRVLLPAIVSEPVSKI